MTQSPVQFARDFARLQSQLAAQTTGDQQLLLLLDFWPEMREHAAEIAYQSYFDEYIPVLLGTITNANLVDLPLDELLRLHQTLSELPPDDRKSEPLRLVTLGLAKMYFYVGAVDAGLELCNQLIASSHATAASQEQRASDLSSPRKRGSSDEIPRSPDSRLRENDNPAGGEYAAFQAVCAQTTEQKHPLASVLNEILEEWQGEREGVHHDRAKCLFVERDDAGANLRGRLRTLTGKVELFGKSARTDEITFENQIKTPDDPFAGVAYEALTAVRKSFRAVGMKDQGAHFYHAHFGIEDSGHTFTGDSIGLAFGLLAYTQLLRPEVLRLDRFLSGEVAFTGGVDSDGRLTPVNDETLPQKITRAFFSPVKYVVLPEANLVVAKQHLDSLRRSFPRRNLHLIADERFADIIEDHNIVRSEKVCIGEFVAKTTVKYARMTKVQVPLLLLLGYLLLCLVYPKAWVGFDWEPDKVRYIANGFAVYNDGGYELWRKALPPGAMTDDSSHWELDDLDGDGWREVLIMPQYAGADFFSGWVFGYDHRGDSLFARDCAVRGRYPLYSGEKESDTNTYDVNVEAVHIGGKHIVITQIYEDYPDRGMIRFIDSRGNFLGWYVNAGGTNLQTLGDVDGDGVTEPIFFGFNQLLGCSALFALSPDSSKGVSPPYQDNELDLNSVTRGSQIRYVMFPPTDVGRYRLRAEYNSLRHFTKLQDGSYRVSIVEDDITPGCGTVDYFLDPTLRATRARLSDVFIKQRRALVESDSLKSISQTEYEDLLRDNVTYWIGEEYITEGELRATGR